MPSFGRFLVARGVRAALTIWIVVSAVFIILRLSGDPVTLLLSENATPDQIESLRARLGLDAPLFVQYARYWASLVQGDFGDSLRQRQPALRLVFERMPATLQLAAAAFGLAVAVGLTLGTFAALLRGTIWDRLAMSLISVLQSGPAFFVGIVLILIFGVRFGWLPSSGRGDAKSLILPAITLSGFTMASLARLARSALLDVLRLDYIRTARAKGLGERAILLRHAFRNAALPLITVMGLELGGLVTGAVITETVFAWPGVGRLAVGAVSTRDYPVVQASVLFIAAIFVLVNFLVDCSYALIDPRVRGA
ncbi:MAG TPA: ABC transporter permease [Thermomicrobiales bacterium]|jgi:peptide/nickel transport system permease protein